jgi:hypothetical protein
MRHDRLRGHQESTATHRRRDNGYTARSYHHWWFISDSGRFHIHTNPVHTARTAIFLRRAVPTISRQNVPPRTYRNSCRWRVVWLIYDSLSLSGKGRPKWLGHRTIIAGSSNQDQVTMSNTSEWLPPNPEIKVDCDGCSRGIPIQYFEYHDVLESQIYNTASERLVVKWTHCRDCADEIRGFIEQNITLTEDRGAREIQPLCGLCGDNRDGDPLILDFRPSFSEAWTGAALCEDCGIVMENYISSIPEESTDGPDTENEIYFPKSLNNNPVRKHRSEVDQGPLIEQYRELEEGDEVYFEAHQAQREQTATLYISGKGRVESVSSKLGDIKKLQLLEELDGVWYGENVAEVKLEGRWSLDPDRDRIQVKVQNDTSHLEEKSWHTPKHSAFSGILTVLEKE